MSAAAAPPLAADLEAALRRLKLASVRRLAPEVLLTARTQRWPPEELLRTLLEAELAARDASNARARLRAAGFPVQKTLAEFVVTDSSLLPRATSSRTRSSCGESRSRRSSPIKRLPCAAGRAPVR